MSKLPMQTENGTDSGTETTNDRPTDADPEGRDVDWEQAREATRLLLDAVGEDPDREGLRDTWQRRVPEAFAELTEGSHEDAKPTMRTFSAENDELVVKTGVPFYALCEHHLLPFHGTAHVAYRPDEEVVGLSKLARYVRWRSRQLTMQERLTREIADGLAEELDAPTVLVELTGTHLCEAMRGVETESTTTTRSVVGDPTDAERRRFRDAIARTAEGDPR